MDEMTGETVGSRVKKYITRKIGKLKAPIKILSAKVLPRLNEEWKGGK